MTRASSPGHPGDAREQAPGDDQLLDLGGALVDLGDLGVPEVPLHLVLLDEAVAAVHLDGVGGDAHRGLRREELGHGRLRPVGRARILAPGRAEREQAGRLDRGRHVGQHPLHHLVLADGHPEAPALPGVGRRRLVRGLRDAHRLRRDADTPGVERPERDLESLSHLAQPVGGGNPAALEEELGGVRGADAELVLGLDHREAGRPLLDQEGADAAMPGRAIGLREDEGGRGLAPVGHEDLPPVEHVAVSVPRREGGLIARVRPRLRLGESEATELPPGCERREEALLLLLGAVRTYRVTVERVVHRHDDRVGRAGPGQLLHGEDVAHRVTAAAPISLRHRDAHQAQLGHPGDGLTREAGLTVEGLRDRTHLFLRELAGEVPDHGLLFREVEVQASVPFYFSKSCLNSLVSRGATSKRSPTIP
jgi:hypothetical protein